MITSREIKEVKTYPRLISIQRVAREPHPLLHLLAFLHFVHIVLIICCESKLMYCVAEVVAVAIVLEIWYKLVDIGSRGLERFAG